MTLDVIREITVTKTCQSIDALKSVIDTLAGNHYSGIFYDGVVIRVGAITADTSQDATVEDMVNEHSALNLNTDKATITADNSDTAIITCSNAIISGDSDISYEVRDANGNIDFSGSVPLVAGTATYEFKTAIADTYQIRFFRQGASNYEDGYVNVEATA